MDGLLTWKNVRIIFVSVCFFFLLNIILLKGLQFSILSKFLIELIFLYLFVTFDNETDIYLRGNIKSIL